jgi:hypothetical protein
MFSNSPFMFNQLFQPIFMFGPHPNLFRPLTELAWPFLLTFPLPLPFSLCSLTYGARWSAQSRLPWAIRTQERVPARCTTAFLSLSEFEPSTRSPGLFKRARHLLFPIASASPSCAALHRSFFSVFPAAAAAARR